MPTDLDRVAVTRKSGREQFRNGSSELGFDLLGFWQWSASSLLSNATRGVVAEYLVAHALCPRAAAHSLREEWAAYDLESEEGIKVEVKSAAYLQSWFQERLSHISFGVRKRRPWDSATNRLGEKAGRQADVYVFAVLAHQDKKTVDPMDANQWRFYVLPTAILDGRTRSQDSITLPTLDCLCKESPGCGAVDYGALRAAVVNAAKVQRKFSNTAAPAEKLGTPPDFA
jgi:hypothetical protein